VVIPVRGLVPVVIPVRGLAPVVIPVWGLVPVPRLIPVWGLAPERGLVPEPEPGLILEPGPAPGRGAGLVSDLEPESSPPVGCPGPEAFPRFAGIAASRLGRARTPSGT
jgi:hypothetical protein